MPDDEGRRKLIGLYARDLTVADQLVADIVRRTQGASPAFIKELMRRAAQCFLRDGADAELAREHIELALDDMLFSGGSLNVKLLGGMVCERE
jgi:ATP-dependent 26S proteasome regulatory subunit